MKYLYTAQIILLITVAISNFSFAQDSLTLESKALLKQLESGVSPARGAIIDLVKRYQENGQQTKS